MIYAIPYDTIKREIYGITALERFATKIAKIFDCFRNAFQDEHAVKISRNDPSFKSFR